MTYQVNRTAQLADAHAKSRFGQKASLQAQNVPTAQHNVNASKSAAKKAAKKSTSAAKKTAKKS